jgi:hypothetical protein
MSLLPNVERELMRVARTPVDGTSAQSARGAVRARMSGATLAVAVAVVALVLGAGFLVALRGSGTSGGAPTVATQPPAGHRAFPGAPRPTRGHFTHQGTYVCRRAPRNRYLPPDAGCVSVLRADMTGDGRPDLVLLYAQALGSRRVRASFEPIAYTLELVRPGGAITRTRLPTEGNRPVFERVGNINRVPGDELVLLLAYISSGDNYGIVTLQHGRLVLADDLLPAGGDSGAKEGFACTLGPRPRVVSRTMALLGPTMDGRWRWTVSTYTWRGSALRRVRTIRFVRRGVPPRRDTAAGTGCGRPIGARQAAR